MLYPILIVPNNDTGRNGVFIYIGCPEVVDRMRGYDAGFAHASCVAYSPVLEDLAARIALQRTEDQQKFVDKFLANFHNYG